MPPIYSWECDKCGVELDLIRSFSESDKGPELDELPTEVTKCEEHKWKKVMRGPPTLYRGRNWGPGSKGHWLLLIGISSLLGGCVTALDFSPRHQLIKRDRCGESPVVDYRDLTAEHDYVTWGCR